ncbi:hypothetical protein GY45DRAFT_1325715 [Cubamyces sp. BRFM 1775]|nr:hypothetical protein GY45DRAFT_1325715 [Cubamyces sp. BRFM 1775]
MPGSMVDVCSLLSAAGPREMKVMVHAREFATIHDEIELLRRRSNCHSLARCGIMGGSLLSEPEALLVTDPPSSARSLDGHGGSIAHASSGPRMGGGNEDHEGVANGTSTAPEAGNVVQCTCVGRRKLRWSGTRARVQTDGARVLMAKYKGLVLGRMAARRPSI